MFSICGYNFCADKNALDAAPVQPDTLTESVLTGGIFDHWNITRNIVSEYSPDIPTVFDFLTIMNANFNGNLNAGNIDFALDSIDGFNIKRRKVGTFNWINLYYVPVSDISDFNITYNDNLAQSGVEYEYALVPVVGGVEGNYISDTIGTEFDGVFICDANTIYQFYAGVQYGTSSRVQKVGVFEPFGRQYPVVVSNGATNYESGSISGQVLSQGYLKNGEFNRIAMVNEQNALVNFLTNKKAKIIKDWNGRIWLCVITSAPSIEYEKASGMALATVGVDYAEIGDSNNQTDLYNAGLVSEVE